MSVSRPERRVLISDCRGSGTLRGKVRAALEALATAMPGVVERATVLRRLAVDQRLSGDKAGAAATLE